MAKSAELKNIEVAHLTLLQGQAEDEKNTAEEILQSIDDMVIDTQEDLEFAGEILTEIKGKKKALENERSKATKPLRDVINLVQKWFKPAVDYYGRAESRLKNRIAEYHNRKRAEQQAALEVAGEASMAGDASVAREAMQIATDAQVHKVAGVSFRDVVKYEVVDISLIPREFLMIDDDAVSAYIAKNGAASEIPGIRIWKDVSVAARAAK